MRRARRGALGLALTALLALLPPTTLLSRAARADEASARARDPALRSVHSRVTRSGPKLPQSNAEARRAQAHSSEAHSSEAQEPVVTRTRDGSRLYRARAKQPLLIGYTGCADCERWLPGLGPGLGVGLGIGLWPGLPYRYPGQPLAPRPPLR